MLRFLSDLAEAWRAFKAQHWLRDRLDQDCSDYAGDDWGVPPSIPDAGRELASWNALNTKERFKARAREMRAAMGLDALDALN